MKKKNIIILTIILLIVLIVGAYGTAMTVIKGKGYFIVAKPICETEIEEASQTDSLGSYYNVKIKNYNADNEVSMVNSDYEVVVEQADGDELPDYYWYDQDGNIIGKKLTGSLQHTDKQEKIYKLGFASTGEKESTSQIKISTKATQKSDQEWIDADITAITGLSTKPASSVTVTITGPEKSNITLDQNPYSFDGGKTWQSSNSKEFVQNSNDISIKVKGSDGKIYVHPQFDITNIQ